MEDSNFNFKYVRLCELRYSERKIIELFANSGDPDHMLHSAVSDLGLHCLPFTLLGVSRLQWVKAPRSGHFKNTVITLNIRTDRPEHIVLTQIRHSKLQHLIRVYTVCHKFCSFLDMTTRNKVVSMVPQILGHPNTLPYPNVEHPLFYRLVYLKTGGWVEDSEDQEQMPHWAAS